MKRAESRKSFLLCTFEIAALGAGFLREQFRVVWGHAVTSDSWGAEVATRLSFSLAYLNI